MSRLHAEAEKYLTPDKFKDGVTEASLGYNPIKDTKRLPIRVRQADEGDASFIYSSWLKSYAAQNKDQPKLTIYEMHREVVSRLLESGITLVACMEDDPDQVLAWLCGQRIPKFLIVHYCYTKAPFRKFGLARTLLNAFDYRQGEPIVISHKGYICKDLKGKYNFLHIPHLQQEGGLAHMEEIYNARNSTATDG
jgi:hypothetical protein